VARPKVCSVCGATKHLSQFPLDKRAADGHASRCKTCNRRADASTRDKQAWAADVWAFEYVPNERHIAAVRSLRDVMRRHNAEQ
jgi:hypothetical protein